MTPIRSVLVLAVLLAGVRRLDVRRLDVVVEEDGGEEPVVSVVLPRGASRIAGRRADPVDQLVVAGEAERERHAAHRPGPR